MGNKQLVVQGVQCCTWSVLMTTLAIHMLSLALPIMTLQVYDRVLPHHTTHTLEILIIGVCIAIALEAILKVSRAYVIGWTGAAFEHRLSCELVEHTLAADLKHLKREGIGADLQRLTAASKLKGFYNGELFATFLEGVFVVIFIALIWYIAGALVLVPLTILALFSVLTIHLGKHLKEYLDVRNYCDDNRYNFLVQALAGVHTIKASGLEQIFRRRYEFMEQQSGLSNLLVARSSSSAFNSGAVFSHMMVAAVITFGALQVIDNKMTVGALVACILLAGRIMQPVQKILQVWVRSQDFDLTQKQVKQVLDTPTIARPKTAKPIAQKGHVGLEDVCFRYDDNAPWMLERINLEIKPGETIHITGHEGAGKSTLLKIIAGIYKPDQGSVAIDGHSLPSLSTKVLSRHVAYLSDTNSIFRGTIRDNLTRFGMVSGDEALKISNELSIQEDIARLPAGFDTNLEGTIADSIPPGLKQRILIARALAPQPRIILFDNADRALDRQSFKAFRDYLKQRQPDVAMIIISDDAEMVALAQKHYLLYEGQLIEQKAENLEIPTEEVRL